MIKGKIPILFQKDSCPFCGVKYDLKNKETKEHLFPKWLLRKCKLNNEKLVLLNGVGLEYKKIIIPICSRCNNNVFSKLEGKVKNILEKSNIHKSDQYHIVVWLTKIYLGIKYLEQRLLFDIKNPKSGTILNEDFLSDQGQLMFTYLSTYGKKVDFFNNVYPWSFFVYKISKKEKEKFWFSDDMVHPVISILIGDTGIVCCLTDAGGQAAVLEKYYPPTRGKRISLLQFMEKTFRHFYKEYTRDYGPKFISTHKNDMVTIITLSGNYYYKKWIPADFNRYFLKPHGIDVEKMGFKITDDVTLYAQKHPNNRRS